MEQLAGHKQAKSPFGKLLVALTEENAWSRKYEVYASFEGKPYLSIFHPKFLSGRPLIIDEEVFDLSVHGMENAVRAHIQKSKKSLEPGISLLQDQANDLYRTFNQIDEDKARAAIVAVFPEADVATRIDSSGGDLYSFYSSGGIDSSPIFVARNVGGEFVGGVARINCAASFWYGKGTGIGKHQKHGLFWTALAQTFAAQELQVPEDALRSSNVVAREMPWQYRGTYPKADPYVVEKVVLRLSRTSTDVVVHFGANNLPVRVEAVPDTANLSLVDRDMTP